MNRDYDNSDDGEFSAAIAAAAFAIYSLEETGEQNQKNIRQGPEKWVTEIKSKKEDRTIGLQDPIGVSRKIPNKDTKEDKRSPGEASMKKPGGLDQKEPGTAGTKEITQEKVVGKVPSFKRTPTFGGQNLKGKSSMTPQMAPPPTATGDAKQNGRSTKPGSIQSTADAWEKAEIDKINERYKKMSSTIVSWEDGKKTKAKRRLEKREAEMDQRRARTMQHYRNEMTRIDQVAKGARTKLEEQRRNEEAKAKEKAEKIRTTGKAPTTCFCF